MASFAAVAAVAGASAAGFASAAKPHPSPASFTPNPAAVAQATEVAYHRSANSAALAEARRVGVWRAIALTRQHKAEAVALARAREKAAALTRAREQAAALTRAREQEAALTRAREEAAAGVARAQARESLLARAQSDPKSAGRLLAADRGWEGEQFECLSSLWTKESGWRWNADNPSSDAYGIPQSLPGSKMASMGSDWETNPITQIKWGLEYISNSYGTPCSAWAKSRASNWY